MAEPTEADLRVQIERLVPKIDLDNTNSKKFTALLSEEFGGIDLSRKKKFIKLTLSEVIANMNHEEESEEEEESSSSSSSSSEDEAPSPPAKSKKSNGKKGGGGGGGLAARKEISDELAAFLGKGKTMARTEIVKELWVYIKAHDLQNPNDKREILLDDAMQQVFGCKSFTMFSMNKYVGAHIAPFKPVDLTTSSAPKKRKAAAKGKDGKPVRKKPKAGTQAPYQLSPELIRVVEKRILPRPQVTKALWVYIRKHNLQNPNDKREILCDAKLKAVMGGQDKVTMFSMNKYVGAHLLEKLDKSYYTHEESENEKSEAEEESGQESSEEDEEEEESSEEEEI